jgi:hypothetical protein
MTRTLHNGLGVSFGVLNNTFLEAMFADMLPGAHTIVCAFHGDPLTAERGSWAGRVWTPGDTVPRSFERLNSYLTVSAFEPDPETGQRRRRKANFVALHAVMVDDVGTKVPESRLVLPPSALIETSPRNFQAFYFLRQDESSRDREVCERLVNRMVEKGLAVDSRDPGMKGVTRYGRLPTGINGKRRYVEQLGAAFRVRCPRYEPERRYCIDEIAKAWRLDMRPDRPKATVIQFTQAHARPASDQFSALLRTLKLMGMYRRRNSAGWHDIRCPWVHEHTGGAETGTAISQPSSDNNLAGGFKCHHGHCESRTMGDMWRWARALSNQLGRHA